MRPLTELPLQHAPGQSIRLQQFSEPRPDCRDQEKKLSSSSLIDPPRDGDPPINDNKSQRRWGEAG